MYMKYDIFQQFLRWNYIVDNTWTIWFLTSTFAKKSPALLPFSILILDVIHISIICFPLSSTFVSPVLRCWIFWSIIYWGSKGICLSVSFLIKCKSVPVLAFKSPQSKIWQICLNTLMSLKIASSESVSDLFWKLQGERTCVFQYFYTIHCCISYQ